jgi:hypothetical protein
MVVLLGPGLAGVVAGSADIDRVFFGFALGPACAGAAVSSTAAPLRSSRRRLPQPGRGRGLGAGRCRRAGLPAAGCRQGWSIDFGGPREKPHQGPRVYNS